MPKSKQPCGHAWRYYHTKEAACCACENESLRRNIIALNDQAMRLEVLLTELHEGIANVGNSFRTAHIAETSAQNGLRKLEIRAREILRPSDTAECGDTPEVPR